MKRTGFLMGWLVVIAQLAGASTNNLVLNGSFESGFSSWNAPGAPAVQYTIISNAVHGTVAARITSRASLSQCPVQNITSNLVAEGNGSPLGIGFSVNLPVDAHVRCYLVMTDDAGQRSEYLAEKMVTTTNAWVRVEGGKVLTWQGTLSLASLRFDIGQIVEAVNPTVLLDDVRIIRDTDRDGLTDDVDASPTNADNNSNQLPDGWESRYALTNSTGTSDFDGDGFTDVQEYWAATNPTNSLSLPGVPVNTNATASVRALLKYLALLPSRATNRVVVGQVVTDTATDYTNQVVALAAQTGKWPAMLGVVYDMINGPINHTAITPHATNYWNAGGLIHVQWNPDNPWTGGFSGDTNGIDFAALFTTGTQSHSNYLAYLDEVAVGLHDLDNAGVTVILRILNECNSRQNWYQRRARNEFIPLFRWTYDYLTRTRGLNNIIWVYDSLDAPHPTCPVTYYYPGDDVVDIFGLNNYATDWALPFDIDRLSRDYPKPLAFPESAARVDGSFTNVHYITAISNQFPRVSYFSTYNSFVTGGGSITKKYAIIDNIDPAGLLNHPWVVTREELLTLTHSVGNQTLTLNWNGGFLQSSTDLTNWNEIVNAPDPFVEPLGPITNKFYRVKRW
ncbi:MAG: hypothetical protein EXS18_01845 [Verrucomicrobiae bacterium]|nr:hypothetical protein [Verrucomicrobiae bacterium]